MADFSLRQLYAWLWPLLRKEIVAISLFFIAELAALAAGLYFIYAAKNAIDIALSTDTTGMYYALGAVIISTLVAFVLRTWSSWINQRCKNRMLIVLQNQLVRQQVNAAWRVSHKRQAGDIQLRIYDDASEVVNMIVTGIPQVLVTFISLCASVGFMWFMDARLAFIILCISPLFLLSKFYFKRLRSLNLQLKTEQGILSNIIQENLKYRILIRAMAIGEQRQVQMNQKQSEIYSLKNTLLTFSLSSQSIVRLFVQLGFLVTFCWGVYHLHIGLITFGTMTAFLQLVSRIQSPLIQLMSFVPSYIRFRTATDRVQELLEEEIEEEVSPVFLADLQSIHLKNIFFKYQDSYVLSDVNISLHKGESLAVLGNSGRGKTTLTRLLLALLQPDNGELTLKTSTEEVQLSKAHRINMAYVPQGDKIFRGTVRENILMAAPDADAERIAKVIYLSCAEFIYDLPNGLDTAINETGVGLSEGQAHRIALARALMRPSAIWIFDELTAALDRETADRLMERLLAEGKDAMMFFITHDALLAKRCTDQVYL